MLWTEKYRPDNLESVIGNEQIRNTIMKFIEQNQLPHLILHGGPGIGKTTTIRALIKTLCNPQNLNFTNLNQVLELNASDDRTIKTVREDIADFVSSSSIQPNVTRLTDFIKMDSIEANASKSGRESNCSNLKLVILEEVDSFTSDAQFCLRGLLDLHAHCARFLMTCNDINRLLPALRSRCCEFYFRPLTESDIRQHLSSILRMESKTINDTQFKNLIELADGDLRKAISSLQTLTKAGHESSMIDQEEHLNSVEKSHLSKHDDCLSLTSLIEEKLNFHDNCDNDMDVFNTLSHIRNQHSMDLQQMMKVTFALASKEKSLTYLQNPFLFSKTSTLSNHRRSEGAHKNGEFRENVSKSVPILVATLTEMIDKGVFPPICLAILAVCSSIPTIT